MFRANGTIHRILPIEGGLGAWVINEGQNESLCVTAVIFEIVNIDGTNSIQVFF